MIADMPPDIETALKEERIVCSISAAVEYQIPVDIMLAIAEIEGGKPFTVSLNTNGTVDVGSMQFNSVYLKDLQKFGISTDDVKGEGCYPYRLAAWRIKRHIEDDEGDIWTKSANYHSRTPEHNQKYRQHLKIKSHKWAVWLKQFFQLKKVG